MTARQHAFARAGRADHRNIMPARGGDFPAPASPLPALDVGKFGKRRVRGGSVHAGAGRIFFSSTSNAGPALGDSLHGVIGQPYGQVPRRAGDGTYKARMHRRGRPKPMGSMPV
jgi:hypothetical protein